MSPFLCLMLLSRVTAELATPASLLGPRHYNHHAYEQYLKEVEPTKQGPVLFPNDAPPPPRPPLIVTSRPLIDSISRSELNPIPPNNSVAEQSVINRVSFKPEFGGFRQYYDEESQPTLHPIYNAISDHANQNLKLHKAPIYKNFKVKEPDYRRYESNNINDDDNSDYNQAQNYAFSYIVRDHKTGDDFSHSQQSSGSATNGEYRVRLPDGRMQIVSYTADENGYNADVRYDDETNSGNTVDYGANRNFNNNYNGNHNQNYVNKNSNYNGNQNINYNGNHNRNNGNQNPNVFGNQNSKYDSNQNTNYNENQNYNYDYQNNQKAYDVKHINDLTDNNYVQNEETKPVAELNYKDDYSQYADSKEYYGNDYSLEYDDKYNNYDPHKSKFTAFSGPKNPKFVPKKSYSTASTVRPSYEELKPLFVQKKPFKTPLPTNEYLYSNIPVQINAPSTTPSPYFDATTERVVIIGTSKPNFYTNIRNSIPPIAVTPVPKYSTPVTTPRSFLVSTIASIVNLKKNIDYSGAKPVLTNTFIDKINKYLSYK